MHRAGRPARHAGARVVPETMDYWPKVAWMPRAVRSSGEMAPVTDMPFCVWYCSMAPATEAAWPSIGPV